MPKLRNDLRSELARLHSVDARERRDIAAVTALLDREGAFSRQCFEPGHITASAFVIDRPGGLLLAHHHRRLDRWLQLGGHLEPGESPPEAALREAGEESGLSGLTLLTGEIFDVDVHDIPAARGEPLHRHFDLRYVLLADDGAALRMDPTESIELAWLSFEQAWEKMPAYESRRAIAKLRAFLRDRTG